MVGYVSWIGMWNGKREEKRREEEREEKVGRSTVNNNTPFLAIHRSMCTCPHYRFTSMEVTTLPLH